MAITGRGATYTLYNLSTYQTVAVVRDQLDFEHETEVGEAQETLSVDYDGDDVNIGFNARYLLDFLGVVGTDAVKLEFNPKREGEAADAKVNAGDKPGQFKPMDDGMDYRYVVMPMHL